MQPRNGNPTAPIPESPEIPVSASAPASALASGSAEDRSAWASVPWTPVTNPTAGAGAGTGSGTIGWHKAGVPYLPPGTAVSLQTLDVWIPASGGDNSTTTPPEPSSLPRLPGTWIVYIHGGAWRDPSIAASSFTPAATNLLLRATTHPDDPRKIAGLVSLNYRLSPHPSRPAPDDPARQAKHPDHIADVLAALAFLHRLDILSRSSSTTTTTTQNPSRPGGWILTGHSCGATLAFQAVMAPARWGLSGSRPSDAHHPHPLASSHQRCPQPQPQPPAKPAAIVGFNGLYDLAGFLAAPPPGYEGLREPYREFVRGAFGEREEVWRAVCPVTAHSVASASPSAAGGGAGISTGDGVVVGGGEDASGATAPGGWVAEWTGDGDGERTKEDKKMVVLVQSREDTLVPYQQLEAMRACLEGNQQVDVRVREAGGQHDEIWRDGRRMAEVLWEVVGALE